MTFINKNHAQQDLFSAVPPTTAMQTDLEAMFLLLPQSVERKLKQQGFSAPIPSLASDWFIQSLYKRVTADKAEASSTPGRSKDPGQIKMQVRLKRCGTEALALHLYINELLELIELVTAGRACNNAIALL